MADDNLFKKFVHIRSGKEFDIGFLRESNYIETLGLDGPKLMMSDTSRTSFKSVNRTKSRCIFRMTGLWTG